MPKRAAAGRKTKKQAPRRSTKGAASAKAPRRSARSAAPAKAVQPSATQHIRVKVNGETHESDVEARLLLVHYIRETLGLTGTHVGCDTTNCGACTILFNGKSVKSCTMFAAQADGAEITTIEGFARDGELSPVQKAFWENHGLQCGFCTPGMIVQSYALIRENPNPSDEQIRWGISGNLCRCTGYQNIVKSVKAAAAAMRR